MTRCDSRVILAVLPSLRRLAVLRAQGRGGGEWTTSGFDAQRTAWVRSDARLTKDAVAEGRVQVPLEDKFENDARQLNSLTPPVLLDRLIGYRGFKALAFVGGSADRVFAIDTDLGAAVLDDGPQLLGGDRRPAAELVGLPGGLIATPSRRTALAPSAFAGGGGGGGRGARSGSAVGEPGSGAAVLSQTPPARGRAAPTAARAAAGRRGGRARRGRAVRRRRSAVRGRQRRLSSTRCASATAPIGAAGAVPAAEREALGADLGRRHRLHDDVERLRRRAERRVGDRSHDAGQEAKVGLEDRRREHRRHVRAGVRHRRHVYVALGQPPRTDCERPAAATPDADAVVALDRNTLAPKDWFTAPGADFNASPDRHSPQGQGLVAATGKRRAAVPARRRVARRRRSQDAAVRDAEVHRRPAPAAALATWESDGTRWILAPAVGAAPAGAQVHGERARAERRDRRVQAGRPGRQADARARAGRRAISRRRSRRSSSTAWCSRRRAASIARHRPR